MVTFTKQAEIPGAVKLARVWVGKGEQRPGTQAEAGWRRPGLWFFSVLAFVLCIRMFNLLIYIFEL
jgi:hypothetical protein